MAHVERRRLIGIAVRREPGRIELIFEISVRAVLRHGLDPKLMFGRTRRRAVAEQVVPLGVALDARRNLIERLLDRLRVGFQHRAVAADGGELTLVYLGADADREDVERRL